MPSKKWLEKEVTISRDEFSGVIAKETRKVLAIAELVNEDMADTLKELLCIFSACVGTAIFGNEDTDELEVEE